MAGHALTGFATYSNKSSHVASANKRGDRGQPCLQPLFKKKIAGLNVISGNTGTR